MNPRLLPCLAALTLLHLPLAGQEAPAAPTTEPAAPTAPAESAPATVVVPDAPVAPADPAIPAPATAPESPAPAPEAPAAPAAEPAPAVPTPVAPEPAPLAVPAESSPLAPALPAAPAAVEEYVIPKYEPALEAAPTIAPAPALGATPAEISPLAPASPASDHTASADTHAAAKAVGGATQAGPHGTPDSSGLIARPTPPTAEEVASLMRIGTSKFEQKDWTSAELAFRQVLAAKVATSQQQRDALHGLARTYRFRGELARAAAVYEKLIKEYLGDPKLPLVYLELGRTYRALGSYKLALNRFYSVINSTIKLPESGAESYRQFARTAQFEVAETHFQAGDFEQAHRFFARLNLLELTPADRARAAFKSVYALTLDGRSEQAVSELRRFLQSYPDDENAAEARYLLTTQLTRLGRTQESLTAALELLREERDNATVSANTVRNWVYWQRRTGNQLANTFYEQGDIPSALTIYQTMAELGKEPNWRLPALYQAGLCQERLRQFDKARSLYQEVLEGLKQLPADRPRPAGLDELADMASWRLGQLAWQEKTDRQLTAFFEASRGASPAVPAPSSDAASAAKAIGSP